MATTIRERQRARASGVLWLVATALAISAFGVKYRQDGEVEWVRVAVIAFCALAAIYAFARQPAPPADADDELR